MAKKHQHFIPVTYLSRFSHSHGQKPSLIDAFDKTENCIKENLSVKDVCVESDLYTLKGLNDQEKYKVEEFLSKKIESNFPEVYRILVEEKKKRINPEERSLILYGVLSMFFRTPKSLNQFSEFAAALIDKAKKEENVSTINFHGVNIEVDNKSFREIRREIKETHRVDYLRIQIELLNHFVKYKFNDGLMVFEIEGDSEFITCDNPVQIRNSSEISFNLFDPGNVIYTPINPNHALFIAPRKEPAYVNQIFYSKSNSLQHVVLNNFSFENAERWVIGTKNGVSRFLEEQKQYSQPATENHPDVIATKQKAEMMKKLWQCTEKGISNDNKKLVRYIEYLKGHELFNESADFQETLDKFRDNGLDV